MLESGFRFAQRYIIDRPAGKGAMGEVYRARDEVTGRSVALKVFRSGSGRDPRFEREADVLAGLSHPAIVAYLGHGVADDGTPYLVMEWLDGEDLFERIVRQPLTADETLVIAQRLGEGLAAAHSLGIVHRDLKPSNVFLVGGRLETAKLVDFGLARSDESPSHTSVGEMLGTPSYMAPEQARGEHVDSRADMFSLGCVLFECITQSPPFGAADPLAVMARILLDDAPRLEDAAPGTPVGLANLVAQLLAKKREGRPADGAALQNALALGLADAPSIGTDGGEGSIFGRRELSFDTIILVGDISAGRESEREPGNALTEQELAGEHDAIYAAAMAHGGFAEKLWDGTLIITLPGKGRPADRAAVAAHCSLAVRAAAPDSPVVLATGRRESGAVARGEVIERGARLLAQAAKSPAPGVAIDQTTRELLDRRFTIQQTGTRYALIGATDARGSVSTARLMTPSPLVGRSTDLDWLESCFTRAREESRPVVALVSGPLGIGKTRLLREFASRLRNAPEPSTVFRSSQRAAGQPSALGFWHALIAEAFQLDADRASDLARHRIRARVGRHVPQEDRTRIMAFLGALVGVDFPDEPLLAEARDHSVRLGDHIRIALGDFLRAELGAQPVAIVVDDFSTIDEASLAVLQSLVRSASDKALLVLVASRDMPQSERFDFSAVDRLIVNPLDEESAQRIVTKIARELPAPAVQKIIQRAAGNPLFLEELARAGAAGTNQHSLPETLLAIVESGLDRLSDAEGRMLRAASIFGTTFRAQGALALLGDSVALDDDDVLPGLLQRGLLSYAANTDSWSFSSELLQAAAYDKLTAADRALGHRLAAAWLSRSAGRLAAATIADHYEQGGDERQAAMWFATAADHALDGGDFSNAAELGERGAMAGANGVLLGRLRLIQTEAQRHAGNNQQMFDRGQSAMELLPVATPGWWTAAANTLLGATRLGRRDECERLASLVLDQPIAALPAVARIGLYLLHVGKTDESDRLMATLSLRCEQQAVPEARRGWLYRARAYRAMFAGDLGGYVHQARLSTDAFEQGGDARELALELVAVGYVHHELGLYEESETALREALSYAERLQLPHVVASARENLGCTLTRLSRYEEAIGELEASRQIFQAQHNRRLEGHAMRQLAIAWLERGEPARALPLGQHAGQLLSAFPPLVPSALATNARILSALGRTREAALLAADANQMLQSLGSLEDGESFVRLTVAELLFKVGKIDAARAAIREASQRLLIRAARITDLSSRDGFLSRVSENALTLALADEWGEA